MRTFKLVNRINLENHHAVEVHSDRVKFLESSANQESNKKNEYSSREMTSWNFAWFYSCVRALHDVSKTEFRLILFVRALNDVSKIFLSSKSRFFMRAWTMSFVSLVTWLELNESLVFEKEREESNQSIEWISWNYKRSPLVETNINNYYFIGTALS